MSVNPIPAGFHTIAPNIIVKSVDAAVSFYRRAFGAEEIIRLSMPDGKVVHCELKLGDSRLNLCESMEGWPEHTLLAQIFVADSDAVFEQAVKAGAKVLSPIFRNQPTLPARLVSYRTAQAKRTRNRLCFRPDRASINYCFFSL